MSIKSHGGIFGRNPTFNNVEVESLTIAGNTVPDASTILVDGDIGSTVQAYDADTAKLDVAQTFTANQTFSATSTSLTNTTSAGNTVYINGYGNAGATTSSSLIFQNYNAVPFDMPLGVIEAVTGSNRNNGGLVFKTYSSGSNEVMQLTKDLNLELTGGGNVILNSGAGIDFSATGDGDGSMDNELFNDYEEGTFTPFFESTGATFNNNTFSGVYTKVGRIVHIRMSCSFPTGSSGVSGTTSNTLFIKGLPYAPTTNGSGNVAPYKVDYPTGDWIFPQIRTDGSIRLYMIRDNTFYVDWTAAAFDVTAAGAAMSFELVGTYTAD